MISGFTPSWTNIVVALLLLLMPKTELCSSSSLIAIFYFWVHRQKESLMREISEREPNLHPLRSLLWREIERERARRREKMQWIVRELESSNYHPSLIESPLTSLKLRLDHALIGDAEKWHNALPPSRWIFSGHLEICSRSISVIEASLS